ncbi:glycoside hydrolase family 5 protein [Hyphomicrobium facile]|uniref:Aryl-phospho-beta-D-glucosidase BglC, GH1 family n=1 Tax=Hyphomicrobium facile TaxID=51670 RepID=A0A1I7N6F6_9HYPH|nr:cellulase family glycosylhydrolase [Hyphomicrobium facile]SFV30163.1 Aryl-phospho-beta-D-glucosidase BglC, GH1 family [Hyphomicrobium facile]
MFDYFKLPSVALIALVTAAFTPAGVFCSRTLAAGNDLATNDTHGEKSPDDFCRNKQDGVYVIGGDPLVLSEGDSFNIHLFACRLTDGQTVQMQISGVASDDNLLEESYDVAAQKALSSRPGLSLEPVTSHDFQYRLSAGTYELNFPFKFARGRNFTGSDAAPWAPGKQEQIDFMIAPGSVNPATIHDSSTFKLVTEGPRFAGGDDRAVRWSILRSVPAIAAGESVIFELDESGAAIKKPTKIGIGIHPSSTVDEGAFQGKIGDAIAAAVPPGTYDPASGVLTFDAQTKFPIKFTMTARDDPKSGDFVLGLKDNETGEIDAGRAGVHLGDWTLPPAKPAMGVNMASGEFGQGTTFNKDYVYPENARIDWSKEQGFKILRVPFKFQNIQPGPDRDIRSQDLQELGRVASRCARNEIICILDMHNYGSYYSDDGKGFGLAGSNGVSNQKLAKLWANLSVHFKNNPYIWFGLMNEPHEQSALEWIKTANTIALAIRDAGVPNKIVFQGSYWDGAHSWDSSDNSVQVLKAYDPLNNFAVEAHQYLDLDSSGTSSFCMPLSGSHRLDPFTTWLKKYKMQGIIGEAGWANNFLCLHEGEDMLNSWKSAMATPSEGGYIGFTYWAAGPWWDKNYPYLVEPRPFPGGAAPPMLDQLKKYIPR